MKANYLIKVLVEAENEYEAREVLHTGNVDKFSIVSIEEEKE